MQQVLLHSLSCFIAALAGAVGVGKALDQRLSAIFVEPFEMQVGHWEWGELIHSSFVLSDVY